MPSPLRRPWLGRSLLLGLGLAAIAMLAWPGVSQSGLTLPEPPNQDPQAWINSKPLAAEDLKDKVVLLEIWTFG